MIFPLSSYKLLVHYISRLSLQADPERPCQCAFLCQRKPFHKRSDLVAQKSIHLLFQPFPTQILELRRLNIIWM